jgi:hypothetical protein
MLKPTLSHSVLALCAAMLATQAFAAQTKAPSGPKLDKYLPSRLPGWLTDAPLDADAIFDHTAAVNQTFSSKDQESGLNFQIQRVRDDSRIGLPRLEKAKLGQLPAGGGFASMQVVREHKALVVFEAENRSGNVTIVAGKCVVTVNGSGVTQTALIAASGAVDLKGLDTACQ